MCETFTFPALWWRIRPAVMLPLLHRTVSLARTQLTHVQQIFHETISMDILSNLSIIVQTN